MFDESYRSCIVISFFYHRKADLVVLADSECVLWAIVCPEEADDKTNKGLPHNFQLASLPLLPLIVPSLSRNCILQQRVVTTLDIGIVFCLFPNHNLSMRKDRLSDVLSDWPVMYFPDCAPQQPNSLQMWQVTQNWIGGPHIA